MEKEFVRLINTHLGIIYKVCNIYCKQPEDRKDLFQEIVLQLWRGYPAFRQEAQFATWMYRVALNTAISNYRKAIRRPVSTSIASPLFDIPDLSNLPAVREDISSLYKAIETLNVIEKAIIFLYLDGNDYETMAGILGITIGNVGVKINRVKSKLEKILKQYSYEL